MLTVGLCWLFILGTALEPGDFSNPYREAAAPLNPYTEAYRQLYFVNPYRSEAAREMRAPSAALPVVSENPYRSEPARPPAPVVFENGSGAAPPSTAPENPYRF